MKIKRSKPSMGPAEHVGQKVDEVAAKVGEKIEQAGENIQDAAKGGKD